MVLSAHPQVGTAMTLEGHWKSLAQRLRMQHNVQDSLYRNLTHRYSEPHRAYHNLNHIKSMLDNFDTVRHTAEAPNALEWAIWYHDVIYDPQLKDNEKLSTLTCTCFCVRYKEENFEELVYLFHRSILEGVAIKITSMSIVATCTLLPHSSCM